MRERTRPGWIVLAVALPPIVLYAYLVQPLTPLFARSVAVPPVSPERLEQHVRALSERYAPRDYLHPDHLDAAAEYIAREMLAAGGAVTQQTFRAGGTTYRNVVAAFGPDTPERIVVGAHYDAAGPFPGADDNASGVAGLIELAALLGRSPPATRVELVAYPLEEPPFFRTPHMGSVVHAQSLRRQGVRVRAMISLEMIGYFTDAPRSQAFPLGVLRAFYPSKGNFITVVGSLGQGRLVRRVKRAMRSASTLPVHSINAPRWIPGVDFSDHASYWAAGYPAVMITDTAFYRNPHYHTARDTADTLDYTRMGHVVQGVYAAVVGMG